VLVIHPLLVHHKVILEVLERVMLLILQEEVVVLLLLEELVLDQVVLL
jgi:hypothetical protein|tara:strand:+ start:259 stop:402 length:144 start_codon:yes stop_codon:yes gene_type:complete